MARKLTKLTFFKNTPLTKFDRFLHFPSNAERDRVMLVEKPYPIKETEKVFNFVDDRLTLRMSGKYADWKGYNYVSWVSEFENFRYYAFIVRTEFTNNNDTTMHFMVDLGMTFLQGKVLEQVGKGVHVIREHLDSNGWANNKLRLLTNQDNLTVSTPQYVFNQIHKFKNLSVLWTMTADISTKWGDWKAPTMETSKGATYDGITSPQNIYYADIDGYLDFQKKVSKAPWIARQQTKVILIPDEFVDSSDFTPIGLDGGDASDSTVSRVLNNHKSQNFTLDDLKLSKDGIMSVAGFEDIDEDLMRGEYVKLELYDWGGQKVVLDFPQLDDETGLELNVQTTIGFNNQVAIYPVKYASRQEKYDSGVARGTYLNNALIYKDFDDVPVLIDQALMAKAQNAYTRQYENSKTISGAASMALDNTASAQDRFFSAASVISPIASAGISGARGGAAGAAAGVAGSLFTSFSNEWDYYRKQKAGLRDLEITAPTLTQQSGGHAFQIANDVYGVTLKVGAIDKAERDKVRAYHNLFGYEMDTWGYLHSVDSMTMMNYVRFSGAWSLPDIHPAFMAQLHALLENGVQLWHWYGFPDPFKDDIKMNKRKE